MGSEQEEGGRAVGFIAPLWGEETRLGFPYNGTPPRVLAGFKSGLWLEWVAPSIQ